MYWVAGRNLMAVSACSLLVNCTKAHLDRSTRYAASGSSAIRECSTCLRQVMGREYRLRGQDTGHANTRQVVRIYLTQYIYQSVLESQLPHKIVNLLFYVTSRGEQTRFGGKGLQG